MVLLQISGDVSRTTPAKFTPSAGGWRTAHCYPLPVIVFEIFPERRPGGGTEKLR
jgi:hypothetical protein